MDKSRTRRATDCELHRLPQNGDFPNNALLPLVVYRAAIEADAAACEALFARHDWRNSWRDGIYEHHHYHADTHEVLGIVRGEVRVRFGGRGGDLVTLRAGDVVVIPAGVAHRNEGASRDLLVVGAYPHGRDWDMREAKEAADEEELRARIAAVPLPAADPIYGREGPLMRYWRKEEPEAEPAA